MVRAEPPKTAWLALPIRAKPTLMRSPRRASPTEVIRRSLAIIAPLSRLLRPDAEPAMLAPGGTNVPGPSRSPTRKVPSEFDRSRIIQAVHRLRDAAGKMGADLPLVAGFDEDVSADRGRGFLGPSGHHGLTGHFPELLRTLEPNFTKALAQFLSPTSAGLSGFERTRSLITALFNAANESFPLELLPRSGADLSVEAEAIAPHNERKRRIDLLIRWRDHNQDTHCLVTEAKFNAAVSLDALAAYAAFARQVAGAPELAHLFLVTPREHPTVSNDQGWLQVTWLSLLRHWERRIVTLPVDDNFLLFRSALWQRA